MEDWRLIIDDRAVKQTAKANSITCPKRICQFMLIVETSTDPHYFADSFINNW